MGISQFPIPAAASGGLNRYEEITTTGTWTHPDGASPTNPKNVVVLLSSGGGGGGSGGVAVGNSDNVAASGGGGGSPGIVCFYNLLVTGDLDIIIGAGGNGGAALSITRNTAGVFTGNPGASGGLTSVVDDSDFVLISLSGVGGPGGTATQSSVGPGTIGAVTPTSGQAIFTPSNGGNGAAVNAANALTTPTIVGIPSNNVYGFFATAGSGGGASAGSSGSNGAVTPVIFADLSNIGGNGGNGATASINASYSGSTAGSNGSGFSSGGGGGGGGAAKDVNTTVTVTSGAGGNGTPGFVSIYY